MKRACRTGYQDGGRPLVDSLYFAVLRPCVLIQLLGLIRVPGYLYYKAVVRNVNLKTTKIAVDLLCARKSVGIIKI